MKLCLLDAEYCVARLDPLSATPEWVEGPGVSSITRTQDELSVICPAHRVPDDVRQQAGWRGLRVAGTLDFSQLGVLSSLIGPLSENGIGLLALSTFDTDYLFVRQVDLDAACDLLRRAGHSI